MASRCSTARACVVAFAMSLSGFGGNIFATVLNVESGAIGLSSAGIDFTTNSQIGNFAGLSGTRANTSDLSFATPSLANFITFQAAPTQAISLAGMSPLAFSSANCFAPPAIGQICTPPGIPLNFTNTPTGVVASFTVEGTANSSGASTAIRGVYTLQVAGTNYQSVLQTLAAGGSVSTTYSAEFSGASGSFTLGGSLNLSSAGVDFTTTASIGVQDPNRFIVSGSSTGIFAPLAGTSGVALDLLYATTPPGDPANIAAFLTFLANPTLRGSLSLVEEGTFSSDCTQAPAIGQICTLADFALRFVNVPGGSIGIFDVHGLFTDSFDSSPYTGLFSLPFDVSYQFILAALFSDGQAVIGPYSASFVSALPFTPAPEPATLALLIIGFFLLTIQTRLLQPATRRQSQRRQGRGGISCS
jgi:hypothetical protein